MTKGISKKVLIIAVTVAKLASHIWIYQKYI